MQIYIRSIAATGVLLWLATLSASAQITGPEARERLRTIKDWDQLCALVDCSQFPVGYETYVFGQEVYYFPKGTVRWARTVEWGENGDYLRSFGNTISVVVNRCCQSLLSFFGLAEDFPRFRDDPIGHLMQPARTIISSSDTPYRENRVTRHFDVGSGLNRRPSIHERPSIDAVLSENQLSYNDDFWLTEVRGLNEDGTISFEFLSKRPLLNGYYVFGGCGIICSFHTLAFAETQDETRPHVSLRWMTITGKNAFLCTLEELENGCDPAPKEFDGVPKMLGLIEDMFEAAQVHPENRG